MGRKKILKPQQSAANAPNQNKKPLCLFGKNTFRHPDRIVRFTWWVAAFTFCLACTGIIQAWAFIQSERAFVTVAAMRFDRKFSPNADIVLAIELKNGGKGTAIIEAFNSSVQFVPQNLATPPNPLYRTEHDLSLGPILAGGIVFTRSTMNAVDGSANTLKLDESAYSLVMNGQVKMRLFGYVQYTDDFSMFGHRTTGYCYIFNPQGNESTTFDGCPEKSYTYAQ